MKVAAVIPARMGSTRYPGKPLCDIQGMTMIEHVFRRTDMSSLVDRTYIATPDVEIRDEAEEFGASVIMTGSHHKRATDRVAEAAESIDAGVIVVMQGDEPLVYPEMLDRAIQPILDHPEVKVTNLGKPMRSHDDFLDENNVKVVVDEQNDALYFSRAPIPHLYDKEFDEIDVYHQVCVIPFERDHLFEFIRLDETPLEAVESIDMLRLLEHGRSVRIVESEVETYPVDTPADHEKVDEIMANDPLFDEYAHLAG